MYRVCYHNFSVLRIDIINPPTGDFHCNTIGISFLTAHIISVTTTSNTNYGNESISCMKDGGPVMRRATPTRLFSEMNCTSCSTTFCPNYSLSQPHDHIFCILLARPFLLNEAYTTLRMLTFDEMYHNYVLISWEALKKFEFF